MAIADVVMTPAMIQARNEMLRHLSQRTYRVPRKLVKHWMHSGGNRRVLYPLLVKDKQLQHFSGKGR